MPKHEVKVLGVILDQQPRFKERLVRAGKRGLKAAFALKRIKGLDSRTARTLFTSKVTPVIHYVSPIWPPKVAKQTTNYLTNHKCWEHKQQWAPFAHSEFNERRPNQALPECKIGGTTSRASSGSGATHRRRSTHSGVYNDN